LNVAGIQGCARFACALIQAARFYARHLSYTPAMPVEYADEI
jgi:hypothetical protein